MTYFGRQACSQVPFALPTVTVGQWGAEYTGTTEASVQAAVDQLGAGGGVLEIVSGTIRFRSPVTITGSNVHIRVHPGVTLEVDHAGAIGLFHFNGGSNVGIGGSGVGRAGTINYNPRNDQKVIQFTGCVDAFARDLRFDVIAAGSDANPHTLLWAEECLNLFFERCLIWPNEGTRCWYTEHCRHGNWGGNIVGPKTAGGSESGVPDNAGYDERLMYRGFESVGWARFTSSPRNTFFGLGEHQNSKFVDGVFLWTKSDEPEEEGHFEVCVHMEGVDCKRSVRLVGALWADFHDCDFGATLSPSSFDLITNFDATVTLSTKPAQGAQPNIACTAVRFSNCRWHNNQNGTAPSLFMEGTTRCTITNCQFELQTGGPSIVVLVTGATALQANIQPVFANLKFEGLGGAAPTVPISFVRFAAADTMGPVEVRNCSAEGYSAGFSDPIGTIGPVMWHGLAFDADRSITSTAIALQTIATAGGSNPRLVDSGASGLFANLAVGDKFELQGPAVVANRGLMRVTAKDGANNWIELAINAPIFSDFTADAAAGPTIRLRVHPRLSTNHSYVP